MPVLIDGNNLLHAALAKEPERPPSRSTLCRLLGLWSRRSGEKVSIIFDGPAPNRMLIEQISDSNVDVSYSGGGVQADEVLENAIKTDSAPRRLLVVSTDREVANNARRRRAKTIRSADFWEKLINDLARQKPEPLEPPEKMRGITPTETQRWFRELGLDEELPDTDSRNVK